MTKMGRVIKYVTLMVLSLSVASAQRGNRNQCLKDLRVIGSTPSSITLGWDYKCEESGMRYKVYYEHLEWRACKTRSRDERRGGPGRGNYETVYASGGWLSLLQRLLSAIVHVVDAVARHGVPVLVRRGVE